MGVTVLHCLSLYGFILTIHGMSAFLLLTLLLSLLELMCDVLGFLSALQHQRVRPNGMAILSCGELKSGKVTWSRDLKGRRMPILSTDNGDITRHIQNHNHSSLPDLSLVIWFVSSWDEGLYYCNSTPVACLTVKVGKKPKPWVDMLKVHLYVFGIYFKY